MAFTISNTYINPALMNVLAPFTKQKVLIEAFIKAIDPEIKVGLSNDEFYCLIGEKYINVPFTSDEEGDRLIYEFVLEKFGVSMHPFLLGLCHEVGHIKTYNEDLDEDRSILYYMLQLNFKEENYEEYSKMYFSIPSEFAATEWAVNFYLANKEFCDDFMRQMEA